MRFAKVLPRAKNMFEMIMGRHRVENVVAVPVAPFARDCQKLALLVIGERAMWRGIVASVEAHDGYMNAWIRALGKLVQRNL